MGFSLNSPSGGAQPFPGALCEDSFSFGGFEGATNNFGPETRGAIDYKNGSMWELAPTANATITGMKGGARGRRVTLVNTSGFEIYFTTEDGDSDEVNRFNFEATLFEGKSITVQYSGILSRWVLVGAGENSLNTIIGASEGGGDYGGAYINAGRGNADLQTGGDVMIQGGVSSDGQGGSIRLLTGTGVTPGSIYAQLGNSSWLSVVDETGTPSATFAGFADFQGDVFFSGQVGFFGATPVGVQSITGATTQLQVDSIVAALVALGLVTDNR